MDGSRGESEESVSAVFFDFTDKNKKIICQISQNADDGKALLAVPERLTALKNRSIDRRGFIKAAQIE